MARGPRRVEAFRTRPTVRPPSF